MTLRASVKIGVKRAWNIVRVFSYFWASCLEKAGVFPGRWIDWFEQ